MSVLGKVRTPTIVDEDKLQSSLKRSKIMSGQFLSNGSESSPLTDTLTYLVLLLITLFTLKKASVSYGKRRWKSGFNSIPGPSGLPFIGIAHKLPRAREARKFVHEYAKKYGSIWKVTVFNENIVILSNADHVQRLLSSTEDGHLTKNAIIGDVVFGKFLKGGILRTNDINREWVPHRKILKGAFTFRSLQSYVPLMVRCSRDLTSHLHSLFEGEKAMKFQAIDEKIHGCGIAIISEVVFGLSSSSNGSDAAAFYDSINKAKIIIAQRVAQPWLLLNPIWRLHPKSRQFDELLDTVNLIIKRKITEYSESEEVENDDSGSTFTHMMGLMKTEGLSDHEILTEVKTMIIAGFETTSSLVQFTLFMLALNPEHHSLCRQEIDSIFNSPDLSPEGNLTFESLQEMKYTERCLQETLRLQPVVPGYERKLETPLQLDADLELPVGTTVGVSTELLHRNPEYYPNPEVFDPDRFLPENCAKRHPYAFGPFAGGRRMCPGWKFAMMEAKSMVGHVLREFEVRTTDNLENVAVLVGGILVPERGYLFQLKKREQPPTL